LSCSLKKRQARAILAELGGKNVDVGSGHLRSVNSAHKKKGRPQKKKKSGEKAPNLMTHASPVDNVGPMPGAEDDADNKKKSITSFGGRGKRIRSHFLR